MNQLSWLIYLADVANDLDWFLFWCSILGLLGFILWAIVGMTAADDCSFNDTNWKTWRKIGGFLVVPMFVVGTVIGALVPAKETVYAIAASEMGERALNTTTANKAFQALNSWLDKQIKEETSND